MQEFKILIFILLLAMISLNTMDLKELKALCLL